MAHVEVPEAAAAHSLVSAQQDIPPCGSGVLSVRWKQSHCRGLLSSGGMGGIPPHHKGLGRDGTDGEEAVWGEGVEPRSGSAG